MSVFILPFFTICTFFFIEKTQASELFLSEENSLETIYYRSHFPESVGFINTLEEIKKTTKACLDDMIRLSKSPKDEPQNPECQTLLNTSYRELLAKINEIGKESKYMYFLIFPQEGKSHEITFEEMINKIIAPENNELPTLRMTAKLSIQIHTALTTKALGLPETIEQAKDNPEVFENAVKTVNDFYTSTWEVSQEI